MGLAAASAELAGSRRGPGRLSSRRRPGRWLRRGPGHERLPLWSAFALLLPTGCVSTWVTRGTCKGWSHTHCARLAAAMLCYMPARPAPPNVLPIELAAFRRLRSQGRRSFRSTPTSCCRRAARVERSGQPNKLAWRAWPMASPRQWRDRLQPPHLEDGSAYRQLRPTNGDSNQLPDSSWCQPEPNNRQSSLTGQMGISGQDQDSEVRPGLPRLGRRPLRWRRRRQPQQRHPPAGTGDHDSPPIRHHGG